MIKDPVKHRREVKIALTLLACMFVFFILAANAPNDWLKGITLFMGVGCMMGVLYFPAKSIDEDPNWGTTQDTEHSDRKGDRDGDKK
jgi:hypothetical protein